MKKIVISLVLILALLMCLGSCDFDRDGEKDNTDETKTEQSSAVSETNKTTFELLNDLSVIEYKKVKLDLTTVTNDVVLRSNYVLTGESVTYSVEQLNMLPADGNVETASPNCKVALKGSAILENGNVIKLDGEAVTLPSYDDLKGHFDFKASNFVNIQEEDGRFTAEVISPSSFLSTDTKIHDMKIEVNYSSSALQKITITYKTTDSTVITEYRFER